MFSGQKNNVSELVWFTHHSETLLDFIGLRKRTEIKSVELFCSDSSVSSKLS